MSFSPSDFGDGIAKFLRNILRRMTYSAALVYILFPPAGHGGRAPFPENKSSRTNPIVKMTPVKERKPHRGALIFPFVDVVFGFWEDSNLWERSN